MRTIITNRGIEIARFQRFIERVHSPRLHMVLIVSLTAAVGFLTSYALLDAGVGTLWLRYLIAVAIAYLAFLFFLWCWLRLRRDDVLNGLDIPSPDSPGGGSYSTEKPWEPGGGQFGGGGASSSFDDATQLARSSSDSAGPSSSSGSTEVSDGASAFDLEEIAFVLLAVAALVGAAWATLWIIWTAPAILAELMLDAALATGLYRRLRGIAGNHWLRTAVRRTAWPFIVVGLLFSLAGVGMQAYAPDAKSVGQVLRYYKEAR